MSQEAPRYNTIYVNENSRVVSLGKKFTELTDGEIRAAFPTSNIIIECDTGARRTIRPGDGTAAPSDDTALITDALRSAADLGDAGEQSSVHVPGVQHAAPVDPFANAATSPTSAPSTTTDGGTESTDISESTGHV